MLPWGHFGRKNIGYLFAIQHGAKRVWDTDGKHELRRDLARLASLGEQDVSKQLVTVNTHVWNPYPTFRPIEAMNTQEEIFCWPKGVSATKISERPIHRRLPICDFSTSFSDWGHPVTGE